MTGEQASHHCYDHGHDDRRGHRGYGHDRDDRVQTSFPSGGGRSEDYVSVVFVRSIQWPVAVPSQQGNAIF